MTFLLIGTHSHGRTEHAFQPPLGIGRWDDQGGGEERSRASLTLPPVGMAHGRQDATVHSQILGLGAASVCRGCMFLGRAGGRSRPSQEHPQWGSRHADGAQGPEGRLE